MPARVRPRRLAARPRCDGCTFLPVGRQLAQQHDALRFHPTRLLSSRAAEVDLLCSRSAANLIADENVQLVRHDLVPPDTLLPRSFRNAS